MSISDTPKYKRQTASRVRFERHPLVADMPTLPRESGDYQRIRASVAVEGIREPLKCIAENGTLLVLDGLHRLVVAEELALPELPYELVAPEEAASAICASAVRAGWNKSALAYRMWPLFAALCHKKPGRPKKGNDFPILACADIAEKIGVSEKLMDQAKSLHAFFAKNPAKRAELEPLILTNVLPLHKVRDYGERAQEPPTISADAIASKLRRLPKPFGDWKSLGREERRHVTNAMTDAVRKLPEEVQIATLETLEVAWRS